MNIEEKQKIEIEFWRDAEHESPESDSIFNLLNKSSDASVFLECLVRHQDAIGKPSRVLELGAGQAWASCLYKRLHPSAHVTATDISCYAVKSAYKWERIFEVEIDNAYACKSYSTQELDDSIDVVFCFSAAHHFLRHRQTLAEINRILRQGGIACYFYEPITPRFWYSLMLRRVNKNRPDIPEDVLITSELQNLAHGAGLDLVIDYHPSLTKRGPVETVYFYALSLMPFLQKILPSTGNFIFKKPAPTK